jgi:hypothetical protein
LTKSRDGSDGSCSEVAVAASAALEVGIAEFRTNKLEDSEGLWVEASS